LKIRLKNISSDAKLYYIKGKITMHGKSKNIRVPAKLKKYPQD
jgi:polyisoprenoid-binding protein YceI